MQKQLWLPILKPWERPTIIDAHVLERVQACARMLASLHISPKRVAYILSEPHVHWREIEVASGEKIRTCFVPTKELARIQKRIARYLGNKTFFTRPLVATAFFRGSSIVVNAKWHRYNRSSLRLDITDAFGSVKTKHIERYTRRELTCRHSEFDSSSPTGFAPPCSLVQEANFAWVISRLLTFKGRMRQGAPSSPIVFNLLMSRFDEEMVRVLEAPSFFPYSRYERQQRCDMPQIVYTRYGDDLCFSSGEEVFPEAIKAKIFAVIARHLLRINQSKTREGKNGVMEFPGVVIVDRRIRPQNKYIRSLARQIQSEGWSEKALKGHKAFLHQFGSAGSLKIIRELLAHSNLRT